MSEKPTRQMMASQIKLTACEPKTTDDLLITSKKRILIVDDNTFNIDAMYVILKFVFNLETDSICVKAFNGQEAFDIIKRDVEQYSYKSSSFNYILMDCNMPVMDGYEATKKIRHFLHSNKIKQPLISAVTG